VVHFKTAPAADIADAVVSVTRRAIHYYPEALAAAAINANGIRTGAGPFTDNLVFDTPVEQEYSNGTDLVSSLR